MTQHRFHFEDEKPVYLIDASSINELENSHRRIQLAGMPQPPPPFSEEEQIAVWNGLSTLADEGRLKLLSAVAFETQRLSAEAIQRIREMPHTRCTKTAAIRANYQVALEAYPDWRPRGLGDVDQGDPWLWAAAIERGWAVISEEKRREEMTNRRQRRDETKLPDACDGHNILCRTPKDVAIREGWIEDDQVVQSGLE